MKSTGDPERDVASFAKGVCGGRRGRDASCAGRLHTQEEMATERARKSRGAPNLWEQGADNPNNASAAELQKAVD